ncbi:anaerobic sulfatase maturase [Thaumasiovibrio sp. DFM-14]|uniref:anaerobic sulfatase maturase n=1 Tax=Thaumasiovibrio sp. DFM-14 TaxID=3384792 RepID=UPI0039A23D8A
MPTILQCHVMAKPSSSACNLDCDYCFYLEKEHLYPEQNQQRMSDETLERYVQQYIESHSSIDVEFTWQGGEPTLMGLDFFKKAIALQNKYKQHYRIHNSLQTNGLLLNDQWCEFLKAEGFLVGISIDGPERFHDRYRTNRVGKGSHAKVMASIERLKQHRVPFNTLTVINSDNVHHPIEVYDFLVSIGSEFIQFIPIVERQACQPTEEGLFLISPEHDISAEVTDWSVPPRAFGNFLNTIFDKWVKQDVGKVFVNLFDATLATWCNEPPGLCVQAQTCGRAFAMEANGDVYNCDHFVYPEHMLGNVHDTTIADMNQLEQVDQFGNGKRDQLNKDCQRCEYSFACNGGCPKHRFSRSKSGLPGHNYFCEGFYHFFKHSDKAMRKMRNLLSQGRPASEIMPRRAAQLVSYKPERIARNAPCPCGTGKKSKRCCYTI